MRKLHSLIVAAAILAVAIPAAALAEDGPGTSQGIGANLAVMLCRQEAGTIGKDAFVAKYGATEPFGSCVKQGLPAVQKAVDGCRSSGGEADVRACVAKALGLPAGGSQGDQKGSDQPRGDEPKVDQKKSDQANGDQAKDQGRPPRAALWVARRLCRQEVSSLGKDAFVAKYGATETRGSCVKEKLALVKAAVESCRAASAHGAVAACVLEKLGLPSRGPEGPGSGQDGGKALNRQDATAARD